MIQVSQDLKEAFNPNNGQGGRYIEYIVRFDVSNVLAQEEAVPVADEDTQISRINQVLNRNPNEPVDFVSFEPGGWPLDGSKVIPPKPDEVPDAEIGLVMQDISDEDGYYDTPQVITFTTTYKYGLLALTLDFGPSPAADFSIDWYDGATLLKHLEITDNTDRRVLIRQGVNDVDKIVLTITRSVIPQRKVRLVEFSFGAVLLYDKRKGYGLGITEIIDPLNERVSASDVRFTIDNFAQEFSLFDPTSLYEYFQDRQLIVPKIGAQKADGTMGFVPMGRYYLQRPQLRGNLAKLEIRGVNLLGVLRESQYTKGPLKTATLAEFADDIATDAGVTVKYPASWNSITMTAFIPSVSHAEGFRMLAQATCTLLRVTRDDEIEFAEIGSEILATFTPYDYKANDGFSPSDDDIINTIQVEVTTLSVNDSSEELAKAEGVGTHYLKYDPSTDHSVHVDDGDLVSAYCYADNAEITITGGTVTVTGKKITTGKSTVMKTIALPNERRYVYEVKGQPFIQPSNAESVAEHYLSLKAQHRKLVRIQYRGYPYLEIGDIVSFTRNDMNTGPFILTRSEYKLSGGMTGTLEAREKP